MPDDPAITAARLTALCRLRGRPIPDHIAESYAAALEAVRGAADLDSGMRVCQFLGQIATETGGFRALVESMRYRDPVRLAHLFPQAVHSVEDAATLIALGDHAIADRVYGNRYGNVEPDDGWRFRGRGFIMLTFRANYQTASNDSGLDLVTEPDQLGRPGPAAIASMSFWRARNINLAADTGHPEAVTRRVNSGMVALNERIAWFRAARHIWSPPPAA